MSPPQLREAAVGEAEEVHVLGPEPQVARRRDRLLLAQLPERHVVVVGRLPEVELLLGGPLVAVAVRDEDDTDPRPRVRETIDDAAQRDGLVVGVRGEDEHASIGRQAERSRLPRCPRDGQERRRRAFDPTQAERRARDAEHRDGEPEAPAPPASCAIRRQGGDGRHQILCRWTR